MPQPLIVGDSRQVLSCIAILCLVRDRVACSPGCPLAQCVAVENLEFLILLPNAGLPGMCCHLQLSTVLRMKCRTPHVLGRHSARKPQPQDPQTALPLYLETDKIYMCLTMSLIPI